MSPHVCPWYMAYLFDNPLRLLFQKPEKILSDYITDGDSVIDYGCGMGFFSTAMAKIMGNSCKVISVDIQDKMLEILMKRAKKRGVADRITPCKPNDMPNDMHGKVSFCISSWVFHELPDQLEVASVIHEFLKPSGKFLLLEPKRHVTEKAFISTLKVCESAGFKKIDEPMVGLSHAALFEKVD